jgi:hypothetical protein
MNGDDFDPEPADSDEFFGELAAMIELVDTMTRERLGGGELGRRREEIMNRVRLGATPAAAGSGPMTSNFAASGPRLDHKDALALYAAGRHVGRHQPLRLPGAAARHQPRDLAHRHRRVDLRLDPRRAGGAGRHVVYRRRPGGDASVGLDATSAQDLPHPLFGIACAPLDLDRPHALLRSLHHRRVQHPPRGVRAFAGIIDALLSGALSRFDPRAGAPEVAYGGIEIHGASLAIAALYKWRNPAFGPNALWCIWSNAATVGKVRRPPARAAHAHRGTWPA